MTERWHAPIEQIGDYLADRLDPPTASSVEAHLMHCSTCRSALAERYDASSVRESWASIERTIDGELHSRVQRAAARAGVADREIRTLAPTLSLQVTWLIATSIALWSAALIARRTGGSAETLAEMAFLTIAPLAPLAAVVAALSSASEPAPEIASATPASRLRIGALRATTVMLAAIATGLVASAVLPGDWLDAVVWLLPALALSGLGALIAGRMAPTAAIGWLGSAWVVAVIVSAQLTDDRLAAFRPPAQAFYFLVAVAALVIVAVRHDAFELRRNR